MYRPYQIRRKDRIDEFYDQTLATRGAIPEQVPIEAITDRHRVRILQVEGLQMVIEEKLAADESFRVFTSLINDRIDQLRDLRVTRG